MPSCWEAHSRDSVSLGMSSSFGVIFSVFLPCFMIVCACSFICVWLCNPMDCSPPGSSVHGSSRQEYWSGLPFLLQGNFPTQGLNLALLHCRQILYHLSHQGSPTESKHRFKQKAGKRSRIEKNRQDEHNCLSPLHIKAICSCLKFLSVSPLLLNEILKSKTLSGISILSHHVFF